MSNNFGPPPPPNQQPVPYDGGTPPQPVMPPYGAAPPFSAHPDDAADQTVLRYQPEPVNQGVPEAVSPRTRSGKNLAIILGSATAVLALVIVAIFVWVVPAMNALYTPAPAKTVPVAESPAPTTTAATTSATPEAQPSSIPAGATPLPAVWAALAGPSNVPADGDPKFGKFVTGESSFQYLKEWSNDSTFGVSRDPLTGTAMQQQAYGTETKDADGISTAFAFFAESQEGKHTAEVPKVQAALKQLEAKLVALPAADLPKTLVGHKCASDFRSSKPQLREFRRGIGVVVMFECKTGAGDQIQGVNIFAITPWGTPQRVGVSGHKDYWDAHPGLMQQLGNSYRINKWKQG
ncbi:hypothetical protein ACQR35_08940 [Pseudarthrobacter sp. J1738]|uniref:hypothetical protein n=1 Tax=Pseudarthrobacter sp. J1738 TaxID=3420446 RepID=UPI003D2D07B1